MQKAEYRRRTSFAGRTSWFGTIPGLAAVFCAVGYGVSTCSAQTPAPAGSQTFTLRQGWNAIQVQIEPGDTNPRAVFTNTPVDKVATYFPNATPVEFIQDPASQPWKQPGWRAWFAPSLPESVVSDLYSINAGQCYLVHASAATTVTVQGTVTYRRTRWRADSFNFVGFAVDPAAPPTFGAWFAGSSAHQSTTRNLIYRLDTNDRWVPVAQPSSTPIQPNAAYWVFCQGASEYQGPLDVAVPRGVQGHLDFGDVTDSLALKLANNVAHPLAVTLELAPPDVVPLTYGKRLLTAGQHVELPLSASTSLGTLEAGQSLPLRLSLDRAAMSEAATTVLTVRDDVGTLLRIPVSAQLP